MSLSQSAPMSATCLWWISNGCQLFVFWFNSYMKARLVSGFIILLLNCCPAATTSPCMEKFLNLPLNSVRFWLHSDCKQLMWTNRFMIFPISLQFIAVSSQKDRYIEFHSENGTTLNLLLLFAWCLRFLWLWSNNFKGNETASSLHAVAIIFTVLWSPTTVWKLSMM